MSGRSPCVGLGDYTRGDLGLGCYIVEALQQEPLGDGVELSMLGREAFGVDICVYGAAFSIIVQAVELGEPPGRIQCWAYSTFLERRRLFPDLYSVFDEVYCALARAEFAGARPSDLLFVWIEPWCIEGLTLSPVARKAFRSVIRMVKEALSDRGVLSVIHARNERIYRLSL